MGPISLDNIHYILHKQICCILDVLAVRCGSINVDVISSAINVCHSATQGCLVWSTFVARNLQRVQSFIAPCLFHFNGSPCQGIPSKRTTFQRNHCFQSSFVDPCLPVVAAHCPLKDFQGCSYGRLHGVGVQTLYYEHWP